MGTSIISMMLCIGTCTSALPRLPCDVSGSDGFSGFGGRFNVTWSNMCIWHSGAFWCKGSESCCKQRFEACSLAAAKTPLAMGSISSQHDEEQRSAPGTCPSVPIGYCAVLYDDEDCEGWAFNVPSGSTDLPEDYQNDAEVVVVRSGCHFTGMVRGNPR